MAQLAALALLTSTFAATFPLPAQAVACSTTDIAVERVSSQIMYVDTTITPELRGAYAGYKITNSGPAIGDLWVDITGFTGGLVGLATYEDGRDHLGALGSGSSTFAYFYLVASGSGTSPQGHQIEVYSGHPAFGGTQICTEAFSLTAVEDTIKASANKVQTVVAGPNPAELGGIMTMTVTGETGQVGSGPAGQPDGPGVFVGTPATEPLWRADAYQLVDVSYTFDGFGTFNDTLVVTGLNGGSYGYTAVYTFVAVGTTSSPTTVTPVNYIASGKQIKHTDTSGYSANLEPLDPAENKLLLTKSASPTQLPATGGDVNYTVTISNTGTVAGTLDDVVDTLPAGASYVTGSARFNGTGIPDPYISGQTITFVGSFTTAPGGSSSLTYTVSLPGTVGTYLNSATGHVGSEPIDTTLDTNDPSPASASVQVGVLDAPPVASDDTASTTEDTATSIDVLANDTDPNGNIDPTSVTITSGPSSGSAVANPDGTISYTPGDNTNGLDSFEYEVCDTTSPTPLCDTATVSVTVTAVDDPPEAVDDTVDTDEGVPATWNLVSNDSDPEDNIDATSLSILSGPSNGTLVDNGDGTVTYTPDPGYSGSDSFTYQVCDTTALCDTATVDITVNAVNQPPVANPDAVSTPEDVAITIDVAANDTDPDGNLDPTSVALTTVPTNGSAVVNPDGTITYTPASDYFGLDSFEYEICDLEGLCSTTSAEVTTTIVPVDDPPGAVADDVSTAEDTPATWDLAANDDDPDGNLDATTLTIISGPSHGTVTNNGDGTVTYTPSGDYEGSDEIVYQICDTTGLCDTGTVNVTVTGVDDPPVANDDATSTDQGSVVTIDVTSNDTDPDGDLDQTSVSIVSGPTNGVATNNGDGTITVDYTAVPAFTGEEFITYRVCDSTPTCDEATLTINVNNIPEPPVAVTDDVSTDEDTAATWNPVSNDTDPEDNIDATSLTILSGPSNGTLVNNGDGTVTYTPTDDYSGADSITYQICDSTAPTPLCDSGTVNIIVNAIADPPLAGDDGAATGEDTPVTIDVIANDTDADGDLVASTVTVISQPANGTITNPGDGTLTYTPTADSNGSDSFTYQVCDATEPTPLCDTAIVSLTIEPVNDLPVAADDDRNIAEDASGTTWDLVANDSDVDGNLDPSSLTIISGPSHGTVVNNADGTVTYTPSADYNGADTIVYQVCDTAGECSTATLSITVDPVPDSPVANDDSATTPEDTAVNVDVTANDSDIDGNLDDTSVSIQTGPAEGTAVANGDGTITYTPAADDDGVYAIVYQICDTTTATPLCDTATLTVTVTAVDDAPVAADDTAVVDEDGSTTIAVTANDDDVDGDLDPTTVTVTSPATNGATVVNPDGTVTYTPDTDYAGADSFTYQVCDASGLCDTASVDLTVNPIADSPVTVDDSASVTEDGNVTVDVAFNDSDADGNLDPSSVTIVSGPGNGTATANGDGTITYTPDADWSGTDTITYQICDTNVPTPLCSTGILTVDVTSVPDLPTAVDDTASTREDRSTVIDVTANDTDVDGDLNPASVTIASPPSNGTVSVDPATGEVTYDPDSDWNGTDSFTYQVCDLASNCDTATVTVSVSPVNDAPSVDDDSVVVNEDTSVDIGVIDNDDDIDSSLDATTVTVTSGPGNGSTSVDPETGVVTYTPNKDFNGPDEFEYEVCDSGGKCSSGSVAITVLPVNDPPYRVDPVTLKTSVDGTPTPTYFIDPDGDVFSVSLVSGTLPPGLVLNADGTFSGAAAEAGTYVAIIQVCDPAGACTESTLTIEVRSALLVALPFTGITLGLLGITAVLMILTGSWLRRPGEDD